MPYPDDELTQGLPEQEPIQGIPMQNPLADMALQQPQGVSQPYKPPASHKEFLQGLLGDFLYSLGQGLQAGGGAAGMGAALSAPYERQNRERQISLQESKATADMQDMLTRRKDAEQRIAIDKQNAKRLQEMFQMEKEAAPGKRAYTESQVMENLANVYQKQNPKKEYHVSDGNLIEVNPTTGESRVALEIPKRPGIHPIQIEMNGQPVPATQVINPDGTSKVIYNGQAVPNAKMYKAPSVSLMNRDEMMPVLDRVAGSLAGSGDKEPDLTAIRQISSLRSDQRLLLYDKVKQLNPKFDTSTIDRKIKLMDNFDTGKGRENLQSLDTFLQHAAEVVDVGDKLKVTDSRLLNKSMNWWRSNMSNSPELKRLETALEPAQKEFESYLLGGRALYSEDRKQMQTIVNPDATINEKLAAINQMGMTVKDRYIAQNHSFKRLMGKDLADPFSPEGLVAAKKIGLELPYSATGEEETTVMRQYSKSKKQYRTSTDGGKTWTVEKPQQ